MADPPLFHIWHLLLARGGAPVERPSTLATVLVGFGVVLAVFLLMRLQWRRKSGRSARFARDAAPSERIQAIRDQAEGSGSIHRTMAEATELAQRLGAQLDNKAHRLELLIEDAEHVIERLERAEKGDRPAHPRTPRLTGDDEPASDQADPATRQIYALADEGLDAVEIARRLDQHLGKVQLILALRRA